MCLFVSNHVCPDFPLLRWSWRSQGAKQGRQEATVKPQRLDLDKVALARARKMRKK